MPRRGGIPPKRSIPNVKKVILVASGKGGVGKSTVAGALASARLQRIDMFMTGVNSELGICARYAERSA